MLLALQNLPATSVSRDLALKDKILIRARDCCIEVIGVSSSVLCTSLPLVVQTMLRDESTSVRLGLVIISIPSRLTNYFIRLILAEPKTHVYLTS